MGAIIWLMLLLFPLATATFFLLYLIVYVGLWLFLLPFRILVWILKLLF